MEADSRLQVYSYLMVHNQIYNKSTDSYNHYKYRKQNEKLKSGFMHAYLFIIVANNDNTSDSLASGTFLA